MNINLKAALITILIFLALGAFGVTIFMFPIVLAIISFGGIAGIIFTLVKDELAERNV